MNVYVSFIADEIEKQKRKAIIADATERIQALRQTIERSNRIWASWAEATGGRVLNLGDGAGLLEIHADRLEELPSIRDQVEEALGGPMSVGVGMDLLSADKALKASMKMGGDRITLYTPEVEKTLEESLEKGWPKDETENQYNAFNQEVIQDYFKERGAKEVIPGTKEHEKLVSKPLVATNLKGKPYSTKAGDKRTQQVERSMPYVSEHGIHPRGDPEYWGAVSEAAHNDAFPIPSFRGEEIGMPGRDIHFRWGESPEGRHIDAWAKRRTPDGKHTWIDSRFVGNYSTAGGRVARHHDDEGLYQKVTEHLQNHIDANPHVLKSESQEPTLMKAEGAQDHEKLFHAAAQQQDQEQQLQGVSDETKQMVLQVLQQVRASSKELESLKSRRPEVYESVRGLVGAMIAMAGDQKVQKSEKVEPDPTVAIPSGPALSKDLMPGGVGDDAPDSSFDEHMLALGIQQEMEEHGLDEARATEVAKDHLTEDPHYYAPDDERPQLFPGLQKADEPAKPAKPKLRRLTATITMGNGDKRKIRAPYVGGGWTINATDKGNRRNGEKRWTLTHEGSGTSVLSSDDIDHLAVMRDHLLEQPVDWNAVKTLSDAYSNVPFLTHLADAAEKFGFHEVAQGARGAIKRHEDNQKIKATVTNATGIMSPEATIPETKKSEEIQKVAPPGVSEKTMHKLKAKYGTEAAFKIAWAAHNKLKKEAMSPGKTGVHHVVLPVGAVVDTGPSAVAGRRPGSIVVRDGEGKKKHREARAGLVMAPDGSPTSARNPNPKSKSRDEQE